MKVPDAFYEMCGWFDLELEENIPEGSDDISYAIGHLSEDEKGIVKDFLTEILTSDPSDKELEAVWFDGGARVGFADQQHYRVYLEEIWRRLKAEGSSQGE